MIRLPLAPLAGLVVSLLLVTAPGAQNSSGIQALEAQLREAERAGLTGPDVDMLRDMLEDLKREEAEAEWQPTARPEMRANHFDTIGRSDYGDCNRYEDPQAFAFCASAANAYQSYLKAFSLDAASAELQTLYDAHLTSAKNLVLYLDGGQGPATRSRAGTGGDAGTAETGTPETGTSRQDPPAGGTTSSSLFDDTGSGPPADEATAAMKVYEPMPDTFTGETGWFSKRRRAVFHARLEAVNEISSSCRERGARADRPDTDLIRSGDAPPRWTFSVPDCRKGGWQDEEWACRATVAGHCYWK